MSSNLILSTIFQKKPQKWGFFLCFKQYFPLAFKTSGKFRMQKSSSNQTGAFENQNLKSRTV
ncbi:MAG: hypothetical protein PUI77_04965, partial [Mollicutes bacterium]|nr:hypothetical protein [Mollicutes bacterium]